MLTTKELTRKKAKARYLIVFKGLSQLETAKIVGITPKTITGWAKHYKWHDAVEKEINKNGGFNVYIEGFFLYAGSHQPKLLDTIKKLWYGYINKYELELEDEST